MELLVCSICGNKITYIQKKGPTPHCCGKVMNIIEANTVDASSEKHVPIVNKKGREVHVQVGALAHPMLPEHYIEWILIETTKGKQRRILIPGDKPEAIFIIGDNEEVIAAYAYCNLHSLWRG